MSDDMDAAINLVETCVASLESIDPELATSDVMVQVNRAFQTIRDAGAAGCNKAKLYQALRAPKVVVDQVLSTLIDEGSIEERHIATGKPGRPPIRYRTCGKTRFSSRPQAQPGKVLEFPVDPEQRNG